MLRSGIALWLASALLPAAAAAEPTKARPWHGSIGVGGHLSLTGPAERGGEAVAVVYPGASFGRYGMRLAARAFDPDGIDAGMVTTGIIYEAAAARPRLAMALHADLGVALPDARAVTGAGVETVLWIVGPFAIGLDSTAHLVWDGLDTELILSGTGTLRLAR